MKKLKKIILPLIGLLSLLWFLIRVIPKPSRAYYPCQRAAFPLASAFIIWIIGTTTSVISLKKAKLMFQNANIKYGILLIFIAFITLISTFYITPKQQVLADEADGSDTLFVPPEGRNTPIGEAKGIIPGRVVWLHNPNATNKECTNSNYENAYFAEKNTDQEVVDDMLSKGLLELTGKDTFPEAWDTIFKYFNINHDKGNVGYSDDETIFIKVNAVTAYSGAMPDGEIRGSIEFDTSPQTILALLRQLVNEAGIEQEKIFIGDPLADLWNTIVDKCSADFPNINYVSRRAVPKRYRLTENTDKALKYSDKRTVLTDEHKFDGTHSLYQEMMDADYILNIPTLKGHRWAGVTFFAKNHFGSNTSDGSWQLHKGLINPDNNGMRYGYRKYRVLTDLIGSDYLGAKTLLFFMDGLWATSYEHQKPQKFQTSPFNNDWCSSILLSLDHVAIESVCLDILQKEFTEKDMSVNPPRYTYMHWDGVDDYLHQAADSSWWPDGFIYDPEDDGTPIKSMGVHEHWNNPDSMQYSRNLGTGKGIELVYKYFEDTATYDTINNETQTVESLNKNIYCGFKMFPNPVNDFITIQNLAKSQKVNITIYNIYGKEVKLISGYNIITGNNVINLSNLPAMMYFIKLSDINNKTIYTGNLLKL